MVFTRQKSNIIVVIMQQKKLSFAADKCKVSNIGTSGHTDHSVHIDERKLDVVDGFRYLGDEFTSKGDNSVLCETKAKKSSGTISELLSLYVKRSISARSNLQV